MTKKNQWLLLVLLLATCGYFVANSYPGQMGWWMCKDFLNPKLHEQTEQLFRTKTNSYLLNKMRSKVYTEVAIAALILRERNEVAVVPALIDLIDSRHDEIRGIAIGNLALWKNIGGIGVLMKIVKQGSGHRDYLDVVDALSEVHYEPIYPEILKVTKEGLHNSYAIDMLARFPEKPETLPALKMIAEHDPHIYIRDKAIDKIKNLK